MKNPNMKSKLLFFVFLAIPGCLAYIEVQPLGSIERCPYTKEEFIKRVTLENLEDYIEKNKMTTAACIKEIEGEYEDALDVFVTNMTELTDLFERMYGKSNQNYPSFVSKALKDMGIEIREYVKFLKTASDKAQFEKVKLYNKNIKDCVDKEYGLYERNLQHLETKATDKETDAKNMIHVRCRSGMGMLVGVGKKFKDCMEGRLSQTEGLVES